ncbi:MAG: hypothetical protein R3B69_03310 [Candidatus Paceibacterota bacterium]
MKMPQGVPRASSLSSADIDVERNERCKTEQEHHCSKSDIATLGLFPFFFGHVYIPEKGLGRKNGGTKIMTATTITFQTLKSEAPESTFAGPYPNGSVNLFLLNCRICFPSLIAVGT